MDKKLFGEGVTVSVSTYFFGLEETLMGYGFTVSKSGIGLNVGWGSGYLKDNCSSVAITGFIYQRQGWLNEHLEDLLELIHAKASESFGTPIFMQTGSSESHISDLLDTIDGAVCLARWKNGRHGGAENRLYAYWKPTKGSKDRKSILP